MSRSSTAIAFLIASFALASPLQAQVFGFGRVASPAEVKGWDIDVRPDGVGLPAGRGTAVLGKPLYEEKCAACHGEKGEGQPANRLVGGIGTLNTDKPVMTVGSYWPYATIVFDYINRAMPFTEPLSLTPDEVYSITAYLFFLDRIVGEKYVLDQSNLAKVQMPNRDGFVSDPRPDMSNLPCHIDCK